MSLGCTMNCGCPHVPYVPNFSGFADAFNRPHKKELMRRRRNGLRHLGALGTSPLVSAVAPKVIGAAAGIGTGALIGTAAGSAGAIAFGAAAGSVVPIVGTAVGAVVGFLATKLFGHANYAAVAQSVAQQLQLAEAYKQVAGQYPGRVYGTQELHMVWWGLMHEGLFPKNPSSAGWAPGAVCDIAGCIAGKRDGSGNCPGCGGNQRWVDDLFIDGIMTQLMGFGSRSLAAATNKGLTNPITITDQLYTPAWSGPDLGSAGIKWASIGGSTNPALTRQLVIDTYDAALAANNPNLPLYYGAIPGQSQANSSATVQPVPVTTVQPVPAISNTTTPVSAIVSPPTPMPAPNTIPAGYTITSMNDPQWGALFKGPGGQGYYVYQGGQMISYVPTAADLAQLSPQPAVVATVPVPVLSATGTSTNADGSVSPAISADQ